MAVKYFDPIWGHDLAVNKTILINTCK